MSLGHFHSSSDSTAEFAAILATAGDWRSRLDDGLTSEEEAALSAWLDADERHAQAFAELDETWRLLDRTTELSLADLGEGKGSVKAAGKERARVAWRWGWPVLAAAGLALAAVYFFLPPDPARRHTRVVQADDEMVRRVNLPDGSVLRLTRESEVKIDFTPANRRLILMRGEAYFTVAPDARRPFAVEAAGTSIQALGTAFRVALRSTTVEVLVTEGRVAVSAPEPAAAESSAPTAALEAGEKTILPRDTADQPVAVEVISVPPPEIARVLAWKDQRLDFEAAPLAEIVAAFNRHNDHALQVRDPALAVQRFSGSFQADEPDTFVRMLEARGGLWVERHRDRTLLGLGR